MTEQQRLLIEDAVKAERERCAKIAEDRWRHWRETRDDGLDGMNACEDIAKTIRSRSI